MDGSVTEDASQHRHGGGVWLAAGIGAGIGVALAVLALAVVIFGPDAPAEALSAPTFVDETGSSGIDHTYDGGFSFYVGGGVAVFDCNDDRKPEIFLAGGSEPASLYRNDTLPGGSFRFTPILAEATDLADVTGAYPIDIDGDAVTDLVVLRVGENVVLKGLGDCRFARANETWSIDGGDEWTVAFSALWEGDAALPTLAFGNYAGLDETHTEAEGCVDHSLIRPIGTTYGEPIPLSPGFCTLSILFSDWDGSGQRDLRMANDRHYYIDGQEQLWRVRPGETPIPYTEAEGWNRMQIWGMGIASYDVTGDGRSEVFLTSQGDNKLQTLVDETMQPTYNDIAFAVGATAHRPYEGDTTLPSTAWHPEFQDVNNDGFVDLFISKGNVEAQEGYATEDPNNLLLGGSDGIFTESAADAGVDDPGRSRGAALADFNLDGLLDLVVVDRHEPTRIWRNVGDGTAAETAPMGHWVAVDIEQPGPDHDAIGAWIEVRSGDRTQRREVTIGGGHAGGQLGWHHFGIGRDTKADVRVVWPDGEIGPWIDVGVDRFTIIDRTSDTVTAWAPSG